MAVPWLKIFDVLGGVSQFVRTTRGAASPARGTTGPQDPTAIVTTQPGALEATLANVLVAALKEAFDRDAQRLAVERSREEAERERAARGLRLELLRQASDREVARQRLLAGLGVVMLLATLALALAAGQPGVLARVLFGLAAAIQLAGVAASFQAQARVSEAFAAMAPDSGPVAAPGSGAAGTAAPWLIVAGLAMVIVAVLL